MARVAFSKRNVDISDFALYHSDIEDSLRLYFSPSAPTFDVRFYGDTVEEINQKRAERLAEADLTSVLTVLAALEAAFRIDYLQRCYRREKDPLSRALRDLHKRKQTRVRLDVILDAWKDHTSIESRLFGDLRGALLFRHWLAHGRYWEPKLGRKYDFIAVYGLAVNVLSNFPLLGP
jgi:hypothetical protein